MLVIIDEREIVTSGYTCRFGSEGVSSAGFCPLEFQEWVATVADADLSAVEGFLLGDCRDRQLYPKMIKDRTRAPVIAMNETPSLEQTLDLFAAGVDDVVRKPIHVREILARVGAIRRRNYVRGRRGRRIVVAANYAQRCRAAGQIHPARQSLVRISQRRR